MERIPHIAGDVSEPPVVGDDRSGGCAGVRCAAVAAQVVVSHLIPR